MNLEVISEEMVINVMWDYDYVGKWNEKVWKEKEF